MKILPPYGRHGKKRYWSPFVFGGAIALIVGLGAGTSYAFWTSNGSGKGHGATGTLQPVTVVAFVGGDAPNSQLSPGGPSADVILRINNQNSISVTLVSVTGNGTITVDGGHTACTTTGVSFANQTGLNVTVPAGSSLFHLSGAASMSSTSSTGCQGATFMIPVTITVHK
jgi:hypothetical protein